MMQRNNRQKQQDKLRKDDKQKQKQPSRSEQISVTSISAENISNKQQTASGTEKIFLQWYKQMFLHRQNLPVRNKLKVKISHLY